MLQKYFPHFQLFNCFCEQKNKVMQKGMVELLIFSSTFCLTLIQIKLFLPAVLTDSFSICGSDPKSASQTSYKQWVAIFITLSCVFVLQHTGEMCIFSPFSGTMNNEFRKLPIALLQDATRAMPWMR